MITADGKPYVSNEGRPLAAPGVPATRRRGMSGLTINSADRTSDDAINDIEPRIAEVLDAKLHRRGRGRYRPKTSLEIESALQRLLRAHGVRDFELSEVRRMTGGASKEQFAFFLRVGGRPPERMVLRMDPSEGMVETCRHREAELLQLLASVIPVPTVRFVDGNGTYLGQPGLVTDFVDGVTNPPASGTVVTGVGIAFTEIWRRRLAPQFLENLVRIHACDWKTAKLPHFQAPIAHPRQAALWQVNWWSRVWRDDLVDPYPLITLAERWLRDRLPEVMPQDLVLVHGDYRTGNFMFDAATGEFRAVLDWELVHIGDFHEELGWVVQRLFAGPAEDGKILACSLFTRDEMITRYEDLTGRTVNRRTLTFYELLSAYKCVVMCLSTGYSSVISGRNHQGVLVSFLTPIAHVFLSEIARIINEEN